MTLDSFVRNKLLWSRIKIAFALKIGLKHVERYEELKRLNATSNRTICSSIRELALHCEKNTKRIYRPREMTYF